MSKDHEHAVTTDRGSLWRGLGRRLAVALYRRRLVRARRRADGIDGFLDVAWNVRLGPLHIRPMQVREEIADLLRLVEDLQPRRTLEIGTARGGTLFLTARVASPDARLISVDLPGGPFGRGYPDWKIPLYRSFAEPGQEIHLLRGSSRAPTIEAGVDDLLADEPLDFLLLDGDHRYEGIRGDFERYAPRVRPGGVIALHDIRPGPDEVAGGVPRYWRELRERHQHREILAAGDWEGFGLGLIFP